MKIAVIRFPGANCDQDAVFAIRSMGMDADYVWHESDSLAGFHGVIVPGGFAYGDYLRCGAMASRARVMDEVRLFGLEGKPVLGICNGFQVLCEAGMLPGALMRNERQQFICDDVHIRAENRQSIFTRGVEKVLRVPIAHGEGRYVADPETLKLLNETNRVAFRYTSPEGNLDPKWNFNGSQEAIAGVLNAEGNVLGMMPHPERAARKLLGSDDGLQVLNAFRLIAANL